MYLRRGTCIVYKVMSTVNANVSKYATFVFHLSMDAGTWNWEIEF